MFSTHSTRKTSSSSKFEALLNEACAEYTKQTGVNLFDYLHASKIDNCKSAEELLDIFQEQAKEFEEFRVHDPRLFKCLRPVVDGLDKLSPGVKAVTVAATDSISKAFPPAAPIFSAISILLSTAKSVNDSYDTLVDIFECIHNFIGRLTIYSEIGSTVAMVEVVIKIMVELLSVLALATTQIKQGKLRKFMKTLLLEDKKIQSVLQRLDRLTQQESQMAAAETLKVVCGLVDNMKVVMKDGKTSTDGILQALVEMQKIATELSEMKREELRQKFRRWLSALDPWIKHNVVYTDYRPGTAEWFIGGRIFREWKSTRPFLWVHGLPGSGKSTLCSTIIDNVWIECRTGLTILTFYYFDFRTTDKQDYRRLLSSLVIQLSDQSDKFSQVLSDLHSSHRHGSGQPSEAELLKCLKNMLQLPGQGELYIVIDALDECQNASGLPTPREQVLKSIQELINLRLSHVRICVTSRFERDIRWILEPLEPDSISLHEEHGQQKDIARYVKDIVESDPEMRQWPEEKRELVINTLANKGSGMFRWTQCQLENLRHCSSQDISGAPQDLPENLNETYERILEKIPKKKWQYAHRIFQCLTSSFRPLHVEELAEVFVIRVDPKATRIPEFNPVDRPLNSEAAVQSACPSLVAVVNAGGDQVAQFSHFSVQEFLVSQSLEESTNQHLSNYHVHLQSAHAFFARACFCILLQLGDDIDKSKMKNFPLASYAAEHWIDHHAKLGDELSDIQDGMKCLFDKAKPHFKAWVWLYNIDRQSPGSTSHPQQPDAVPLYYAALCGFFDIAEHLVNAHPEDVNARGGNNVSPLHAAVANGHAKVALLLLEHGADVESQGTERQTPLHIASDYGHTEIVRSLIDDRHANIKAENAGKETPLILASKNGHTDIVDVLLKSGADADYWDSSGWTALHNASHKGHDSVVQLLLDSKPVPNVDAQDINDNTPLHVASFHGNSTVVTILLEGGASVDSRDRQGGTPLHDASQGGHLEAVRLLLGRGADPRARNLKGKTPFQIASRKDHGKVAQLLRKHAGVGE